jgi:hypothetical protein
MDRLTTLILLALATWQTVEVLHHSEVFYWAKIKAEDHMDGPFGFWARLYLCPFCLSHWVAAAYCIGLYTPVGGLLSWWLIVLAAVRLANLGNDLTKTWCQTPRFEPEIGKKESGNGQHHNGT